MEKVKHYKQLSYPKMKRWHKKMFIIHLNITAIIITSIFVKYEKENVGACPKGSLIWLLKYTSKYIVIKI